MSAESAVFFRNCEFSPFEKVKDAGNKCCNQEQLVDFSGKMCEDLKMCQKKRGGCV